ncbi:MAG: tetratricopeptide repeat protein [Pseudomonadota bacterium]
MKFSRSIAADLARDGLLCCIDPVSGTTSAISGTLYSAVKNRWIGEDKQLNFEGLETSIEATVKELNRSHDQALVQRAHGLSLEVFQRLGLRDPSLTRLITGMLAPSMGETFGSLLFAEADRPNGKNALSYNAEEKGLSQKLLTATVIALRENLALRLDLQALICADFEGKISALEDIYKENAHRPEVLPEIRQAKQALEKLAALAPLHSRLPTQEPVWNSAEILDARFQIVPWFGREDELTEFKTWCEKGKDILIRTYHGEGGTGKTRFMIEAVERMARNEDWVCGFLSGHAELGKTELRQRFETMFRAGSRFLVVVDYADEKSELVAALLDAARASPRRSLHLRLVFLSRTTGQWQRNIKGDFTAILRDPEQSAELALSPLGAEQDQRDAYFKQCVIAFFNALDSNTSKELVQPDDIPEPDLSDTAYENTLLIAMAALLAVEGGAPETVERVFDNVIDREETNWQRALGSDGWPNEVLSLVVVLAVLHEGFAERTELKRACVLALIMNDREPENLDALADTIAKLYPPQSGGLASGYLLPDRLGEWLMRQELKHLPILMKSFLDAREDEGDNPDAREFNARTRRQKPLMVFDRARRALPELLSEEVATAIHDYFVETNTALTELSATVYQTRLDNIEDDGFLDSLAARALELNNRSVDYSALGRHEEALNGNEEATRIYRQLAEQQPKSFDPKLAVSLNYLSTRYSNVGLYEDALKASEESVKILRELAKQRPEAFRPDLATSLINLSNRYSNVELHEDALKASEKSVEILRELAKQRPEAFNPHLAISLNNLSEDYSKFDRHDDALKASEKAVEFYRELAKQRPEAFGPRLANCLNAFSKRLAEINRIPESHQSAKEAVELLKDPFLSLPQAHEPRMAMFVDDYVKACEAADIEPDMVLLAPINEVLDQLRADEPDD